MQWVFSSIICCIFWGPNSNGICNYYHRFWGSCCVIKHNKWSFFKYFLPWAHLSALVSNPLGTQNITKSLSRSILCTKSNMARTFKTCWLLNESNLQKQTVYLWKSPKFHFFFEFLNIKKSKYISLVYPPTIRINQYGIRNGSRGQYCHYVK